MATFTEIINHMPESEAAFNLAKESLLARLRTDRIVGGAFSIVIWKLRILDWISICGKCCLRKYRN